VGKTKLSAGILLYRIRDRRVEVLIAHMGGPFWANKDDAGWSIPKGAYGEGEDPFAAAQREFTEETGSPPPAGAALELGEVRQPSGKRIIAWAFEGDLDPETVVSNSFSMEWPRGSGQQREFPEIDRAEWFDSATARRKLVPGQVPFVELLERRLGETGDPSS